MGAPFRYESHSGRHAARAVVEATLIRFEMENNTLVPEEIRDLLVEIVFREPQVLECLVLLTRNKGVGHEGDG